MSDEKDTKPEATPEKEVRKTLEGSKFEERPDMPGVPWLKTRRGIRVV